MNNRRLIPPIIVLFILACLNGYFLSVAQKEPQDYQTNVLIKKKESSKKEIAKIEINTKPEMPKFHYSFLNKPDFFERAFSYINDLKIKPQADIKAFVVNHHLLASAMVAQIFSYAASEEEKTVVLLSPNHFFRGNGNILTSEYSWRTPYGILEPDLEIINKLKNRGLIKTDENPWQEEHGITNLVAFIKKVLPNAKIVPVMVKDAVSPKTSQLFAEGLNNLLPDNALFVGSFDFSHTLPKWAADFHDQMSMEVLKNLDSEGVSQIDIDSRAGLKIMLKYLFEREAKNFTIINHANAADIMGDPNMAETTSYITGYWTMDAGTRRHGQLSVPTNTDNRIILLSLGDLMLDRYVKWYADKQKNLNYPFEKITRFLSGSDITMANMEGPVTNFKPRALNPNNLIFTFSPDFAPVLKKLGFNIFGLANNHTLNYGEDGVKQTKENLDKEEIAYFGDPTNENNLSMIKEVRGMKLGLIGYNELQNANFDKIIEEVKNLRPKVDFVAVFPHWGNEYQQNFAKRQQEKGHQLIDAGADIILGTHPHVIQPMEIYKNRPIFYSLGNFLFDQTFSVPTQQGLGVGLVLSKEKISCYLFPHETKGFQIILLEGDKRKEILDKVAKGSAVEERVKEEIKKGKIEVNF